MKRIKTILLAAAMLLAAPAYLTSCQEDAPEINYTMNVSVINDFTKVVEAINNGFLKNEEAVKKLTEAIDRMNADQQTKLQAINDVLTSVNATLETKLAAIEAAMRAQTLSLEGKLGLLETAVKNQTVKQEELAGKLVTAIDNLKGGMQEKIEAIATAVGNVNTTLETKLAAIEAAMKAQTLSLEGKLGAIEAAIKALPDYSEQLKAIAAAINALPNYGDKLDAIEAAINALPDYSEKFDAVVTALGEMKTQIEALGTGQGKVVEAINSTTAAVNSLVAAVNSGNTSAAAALAQIVQKLEELKEKIGNGNVTPPTPQPTEDYVDLGLPSGIKWATKNLGASKPTDYGDYYAWGETEPNKASYTWATYKWMQTGQSDWKYITKYTIADSNTDAIWYDAGGNFIGDNKTVLDPEDDAAIAKLGSPWRMPTADEIIELIDNCTWIWTTQDGKNGYEVKSKTNGKSIFLPAAGQREGSELEIGNGWGNYWSSNRSTAYLVQSGRNLTFTEYVYDWRGDYIFYGNTIRPVRP